ncbi:probable 2-oxoglutarate-dependent dioxygenase AOP1 [Humulus lupulus]|uniref:probable 2-oxoglutarate-dependent dioxygenase AOP1 n=1 Tax=Humulus lupulus TaxID=3486 RepID=UPI002B414F1D|nr:probable 2-oxoglutarate-dependent dioxygenase AOP1 [Humulus lupulus]
MGSQIKIPVLDFTEKNLKPGSDSWVLACEKIRYGLEEYGCFEMVYDNDDKVPLQLYNSIFSAAQDLFDLPIETKKKKVSDRPGCGYIGQIPIIPLYESMEVDNPTTFQNVEYFTNTMWPQGNEIFRESVLSFSKPVVELYEMATRMVFDSFGIGRYHRSHMESTSYGLRFFKFRTRQTNDTEVGVPIHTDKTFITLLKQNQVDGLQIRTKDNHDHYVDVKPNFSSIMFIAGDALMAWSNGKIRACEHRVMVKEEEKAARYSIGLFSFVNGVMHIPEELVDDEWPLQYKPFDHFHFLRFYFMEGGTASACPIKDYCAV